MNVKSNNAHRFNLSQYVPKILGAQEGRWNTISNGVTQTSLFLVQQRKQETSARRQDFHQVIQCRAVFCFSVFAYLSRS